MTDTSEARLFEKLRAIEALHARPGTTAEGQAAANARERILQRLAEQSTDDEPIEYRFSMPDMWSRRVFVALLRRYGIRPYRYRRQRHTTVMAKVSQRFVDDTLWPQYEAFSDSLREYLAEVTDRVVSQVIHDDLTEASVVEEPPQLSLAIDGHDKAATVASAAGTQTSEPTKFPIAVLAGDQPLNDPDDEERIEDKEGWKQNAREQLSDLVGEAFEKLAPARRATAPKAGGWVRDKPKVGRNEPCPCGSGKKYKRCCLS